MVLIRCFAVVLLASVFCLGCGERKPDTDPADADLKVPTVESGEDAAKKSDPDK